MPAWQTVSVPFVAGLQTKAATAVVPATALSVLENGVFTKAGTVKKRFGYDALEDYTATGSIDGTRRGLVTVDDDLGLVTNRAVYNRAGAAWARRGSIMPATYRAQEVAHANRNQTAADVAVTNGVIVVVWKYATNSLYFQCFDEGTKAPLSAVTALATATADFPQAVAVDSVVWLTYVDTNTDNIVGRQIRTTDLAASVTSATTVTLRTDLHATEQHYSVCAGPSGQFAIAWRTDTTVAAAGTGVGLATFSVAGTLITARNVDTDLVTEIPVVAYNPLSTRYCVGWSGGTNAEYRRFESSTLSAYESGQATSLSNDRLTVVPVPDATEAAANRDFAIAVTTASGTASNRIVTVQPIGGSAVAIRHAHLASHGFTLAEQGLFVVGHESITGLQNTYFLYNTAGECVGSFEQGTALDRASSRELPHASGGHLVLGFQRRLSVDDNQAQYAHSGIRLLSFSDEGHVSSASFGRSAYVAGCQLWNYDGEQPVETGFHMFPDVREGSTTASTGVNDFTAVDINNESLLTGVQYNYRFYYEWYNARGERMRSLPIQRSFVPSFASGEGEISITIPTLRHTLKSATHGRQAEVSIVVYRSQGNLSKVFYRVSSADPAATGDNGYLANSFSADSVTFVDSMSDAVLVGMERDYFSEAELLRAPIPGPSLLLATADRLYLAGGGLAEGAVLPSMLYTPEEAAHCALELEARPCTDEITALGAINETVVAFTRDQVYAVSGPGFDNTGGGAAFGVGRITSDVGCASAGSVVMVPGGLMFKTAKGIYSMDQSFNVEYIGAPVEAYNGQTVTAAHVMPDENFVVFLCDDGNTLMYDYQYGQWGTFTQHRGVAAVVYGTDYAYLRTDGVVYVRNTSSYSDAGSPVIRKVRTGRYRMVDDQLTGWWKLRRFAVLGEYQSPHSLRISIFYGRSEAPYSVRVVDVADVINTGTWGSSTPWGDDDYWGGSGGANDYYFVVRPPRLKCSQVAFEFEDIISGEAGPSFELTALLLEVGMIGGTERTGRARKV